MPPRTAANVTEGEVLDRKYRIERIIGSGGMGVVASAQHLELGIRVAVKLLLAGEMDAGEAVERFSREARAASRLRSEHVVRVFDVGTAADGTPYMVMEYLVGQDLDTLLQQSHALEVGVVVDFVIQACEAVAEAHALGIIHRDLKPRNLFLTQRVDGSMVVKVLDFGIAKRMGAGDGAPLTRTLSVVGSPAYMSPEQMRGARDVDARSDIWSLGVCLYELLTGAMPFEGDSAIEICAAAMKDEPEAPDQLRPDISAGLSEIVLRCLRKDPGQRFQDVTALVEALTPYTSTATHDAASRLKEVLRAADQARPRADVTPTALDARGIRQRRVRFAAWVIAIAACLGVASSIGLVRLRRREPSVVLSGGTSAPPLATPAASPSEIPAIAPVATASIAPPDSAAASRAGARPPTGRPRTSQRNPRSSTAGLGPAPEEAPAPGAPVAASVPSVKPPPAPEPDFSAPAQAPPAPAFDLTSARALLGSATAVAGTTATNVNRAVADLGPRATACYRDALPALRAPIEGPATLHIEADEEGVIVAARLSGAAAGVAPCLVAAVRGRRIPNADTGRIRADVPLTFFAR